MAQIQLTNDDRKRLIEILISTGRLDTGLERQNFLEDAGLRSFASKIDDLTGSTESFTRAMVRTLQQAGTMPETGEPALTLLLRELRNVIQGQEDLLAFVDEILARPAASATAPVNTAANANPAWHRPMRRPFMPPKVAAAGVVVVVVVAAMLIQRRNHPAPIPDPPGNATAMTATPDPAISITATTLPTVPHGPTEATTDTSEGNAASSSKRGMFSVLPAVVEAGAVTLLTFSWEAPGATDVIIYEQRADTSRDDEPVAVIRTREQDRLARHTLRDTSDGAERVFQLVAVVDNVPVHIGTTSVRADRNPCLAPAGLQTYLDPGATEPDQVLRLNDPCIPIIPSGEMLQVYTIYGTYRWVQRSRLRCEDAAEAALSRLAPLPKAGPTPTPANVSTAPAKRKLGVVHLGGNHGNIRQFVEQNQPAVVVLYGSLPQSKRIKQASPETIVVGRIVEDTQDIGIGAAAYVTSHLDTYLQNPDVDYWQGFNEGFAEREEMAAYAEFEAERASIMAQHGLKVGIGAFASGRPDIEAFESFVPALEAAARHDGVLLLHEYSSPWMWWLTGAFQWQDGAPQYSLAGPGDRLEGWTTLRYRKLYREVMEPHGLADLPLIISETGIDDTIPRPGPRGKGWRDLTQWWLSLDGLSDPITYWRDSRERSPEHYYAEQLLWYEAQLQDDPYVLGAAIFAFDCQADSLWCSFAIENSAVPERLYR